MMRQGETAYKDGYQVCLFPLDYLYCTQVSGPGQFSHCCGTATDWIGPTAQYPYYAPCDCTRIHGPSGGDNICAYLSDSEVLTPSGPQYVCFAMMHDDAPLAQTHFLQGELLGHTGSTGPHVTGDHVHLDQSFTTYYQLINSGVTCSGTGSTCWMQAGGIRPAEAYFLTGNETVVNLLGQDIPTITDYVFSKSLFIPIHKRRRTVLFKGVF